MLSALLSHHTLEVWVLSHGVGGLDSILLSSANQDFNCKELGCLGQPPAWSCANAQQKWGLKEPQSSWCLHPTGSGAQLARVAASVSTVYTTDDLKSLLDKTQKVPQARRAIPKPFLLGGGPSFEALKSELRDFCVSSLPLVDSDWILGFRMTKLQCKSHQLFHMWLRHSWATS